MTRSRLRGKRKGTGDLFIHTRNAVQSRLGHTLTEGEFAQMGELIRARRGELVLKQSNSRSIWRIQMPFGEVLAAYDKNLSQVCTVLEPYMVEQQLRAHLPADHDTDYPHAA